MNKLSRPPIITIMGHVDHGKTSLLDYIRETRVAQKEHGGITQHIGAYQAEIKIQKKATRLITFVDTPGHAAFKEMRSRGGKAADIVVLVVASSEGVKPQTLESIELINNSKLPFVVALTKIDLPNSNPDKVIAELAEKGVIVESLGGQVPVVKISSHTGQGIDELLETIILMADMIGIASNPQDKLSGLIIETEKNPHKGIVATAIVHEGTLCVKDTIYADGSEAKVKALIDFRGKMITSALPGTPVQIMGWKSVPQVGSTISSTNIFSEPKSTKSTNQDTGVVSVIVKADTQGSLDAIINSLPEEVQVIGADLGEVNNNDLVMAKTSGGVIITFNVNLSAQIKNSLEIEKVKYNNFTIIYELLDYLIDLVKRTIDPYYDRDIVGKATIQADFKIDKHRIAGCKVLEGEIWDNISVDILRNNNLVGTSKISSLKQSKNEVTKVSTNSEFGCILQPYVDFRVGDQLIAFKLKKHNESKS